MKKQNEDLTDTTCYKTEKVEKNSIHMHDTLKTNCEETTQEKKKKKNTQQKRC